TRCPRRARIAHGGRRVTTFSQWRHGEGSHNAADYSIPEDARDFQGERAGFATRFIASAIDVALVALVMMGIWLGIEILQLIFTPGVQVDPPRAATLVLWGYLLATVYWTVAWATSGRSLGAWVMGVRVVSRKGGRLSWPVSLARAAFSVGFPVGLFWALISKRNRSVQDVVLRTIVIYDWSLRAPLVIGSRRPS
ncbi:MAG: RDD family protein, partial [Actinobacteria bacterium]|nr:RDD family protein [Actinomycetota bacterium]